MEFRPNSKLFLVIFNWEFFFFLLFFSKKTEFYKLLSHKIYRGAECTTASVYLSNVPFFPIRAVEETFPNSHLTPKKTFKSWEALGQCVTLPT